ncbi:MAG: hydrogenase accessory protein HypB, partial [Pseudomonadota bacterium]
FNPEKAETAIRNLAITEPVTSLSARSREGINHWLDWLDKQLAQQSERRANGETVTPKLQPDGAQLHAHD